MAYSRFHGTISFQHLKETMQNRGDEMNMEKYECQGKVRSIGASRNTWRRENPGALNGNKLYSHFTWFIILWSLNHQSSLCRPHLTSPNLTLEQSFGSKAMLCSTTASGFGFTSVATLGDPLNISFTIRSSFRDDSCSTIASEYNFGLPQAHSNYTETLWCQPQANMAQNGLSTIKPTHWSPCQEQDFLHDIHVLCLNTDSIH